MVDFAVCAVDVGTSVIKSTVYGGDHEILGYAAAELPLHRVDGRLDVDPERLWASFIAAIQESTVRAGTCASRLAIASQMAGLVLLDREHAVIADPIVGSDHRALPPAPMSANGAAGSLVHTAAKVAWVAANWPSDLQRARWVGGVKEFLMARLTGRWVTDPATASVTGLYDLARHTWDSAAVRRNGLDVEQLPEVVDPTDVVGAVRLPASVTGLSRDALAVGGIGDGPAANLACGAVGPRRLCLSLGTTLVVRSLVHCAAAPVRMACQLPPFVQHVRGDWYCVGVRTEWDGTGMNLMSVDAPDRPITLAELPGVALALADRFGGVDELYPVGGRRETTGLQRLADQWGLTVRSTAARDGTLGAAGLCWAGQEWPEGAAAAPVIGSATPAAHRTLPEEGNGDGTI